MKQKIIIKDGDKIVFQGRIADMPIKNSSIISKSIELFDDDDPCIIHQSYVIKEYVDVVLTLLKTTNPLQVAEYIDALFFLDVEHPTNCSIHLEG